MLSARASWVPIRKTYPGEGTIDLSPDQPNGLLRGRPRVARLILPVGCHSHPAVGREGGRAGCVGRQRAVCWGHGVGKRAVGRNDGAGDGVDRFAVDELVGDLPGPGVHPVRCVVRVRVEQEQKASNETYMKIQSD